MPAHRRSRALRPRRTPWCRTRCEHGLHAHTAYPRCRAARVRTAQLGHVSLSPMTSTGFIVHDEYGDSSTVGLASTWLPAVHVVLDSLLRMGVDAPVHIVLSDAATHSGRFPPRVEDLIRVLDPAEVTDDDQDALVSMYARETYGLGIATLVDPRDTPPAAAVAGE